MEFSDLKQLVLSLVRSDFQELLLQKNTYDGYKDDGTILPGFLYKVSHQYCKLMPQLYVPVHSNRSIEVMATLYDSSMNVLHRFKVRAHGQNDANGNPLNQVMNPIFSIYFPVL